jgi:hypothetical protein
MGNYVVLVSGLRLRDHSLKQLKQVLIMLRRNCVLYPSANPECLRIIFGLKRDDVTWDWRKLHNEELNDLYCSYTILRVKKSKRMIWAAYVAHIG